VNAASLREFRLQRFEVLLACSMNEL